MNSSNGTYVQGYLFDREQKDFTLPVTFSPAELY